MNRHQKLAIIIVPFLIIGGYVAADYYVLAKEKATLQGKALQLELQEPCDLYTTACILKQGNAKMKLKAIPSLNGQLSLLSNYPLEGVTLSLDDGKPQPLLMGSDGNHWQTNIENITLKPKQLRLVTSINKMFYFADITLKSRHGN